MRKMAENHFSNEKLTNQTHKEIEGNKMKRDFSVPVLKAFFTFEGFPIPLRILKGGNNRLYHWQKVRSSGCITIYLQGN